MNELEKFCNDNLAYLLDRGFKIEYRTLNMNELSYNTKILIHKYSSSGPDTFNWFDVCDEIMPLLQILSSKYETNWRSDFLLLHGSNGETQTWKNKVTLLRAESGYNSFNRKLSYIEIRIKT